MTSPTRDGAGPPNGGVGELGDRLAELGADVHGPLDEVSVPMYVLARDGTILWMNRAATALVPAGKGKEFGEVLAPEVAAEARRRFMLRMRGREAFTDHRLVLRTPAGTRREVEISSAPLRDGHRIVGVFGVVQRVVQQGLQRGSPPRAPDARRALTPRQHEILQLLGDGLTTGQMAERLTLSTETVRNHVRAVLSSLEARSRLEAVLLAHRRGLLDLPADSRHPDG
jgi:DNA-binding CsgD family transcriptional regulator